ncbi:arylsulfatase B-like isoform X2 [Cylas formicarius]|uniref:arylsulfatase B-like isoform X2 n=1 Tax=Cylas formicarius TaxID=197179 RepID=UPI0029585CDB|nr:arylsulfatase B-like isoform X2 [Cylas formicarius]
MGTWILFAAFAPVIVTTINCDNTIKPNIIFILADDLGWNDVGFHGMTEIPTPNIDVLAYSGVILNNYYVNPICTPSRAALLTGKYPIHTGLHYFALLPAEPRGLNLSEKLLPEYLKDLGYVNHIIGKWHLGYWKKEYTPTFRGFDSHLGFWNSGHDYFDHTKDDDWPSWGLDMRRNMDVAYDLHGQYSTDVFTREAIKIINNHNQSKPLFLYLAQAAVHAGNFYNPLPAPDEYVAKFNHIQDSHSRRKYAAILSKLDDSVGQLLQALANNTMLENSIIIFSSDNGASVAGAYDRSAGSNWPLRGAKNSLWEGGVRATAAIWSPLIKKNQRVSHHMMNIVDWLPTILEAAGGNLSSVSQVDGVSLWNSLVHDEISPRTEMLLNIDPVLGKSSDSLYRAWSGPSGRGRPYNVSEITYSLAYRTLHPTSSLGTADIKELRTRATVSCNNETQIVCDSDSFCLFDIERDPCEYANLADKYPNKVEHLIQKLSSYNKTTLLPGNVALDPNADPRLFNNVWTNWGDVVSSAC